MKRIILATVAIIMTLSLVSCSFGSISIVSDTSSESGADTAKGDDTGRSTESESDPETEPAPAGLFYSVKEFSTVKADRIQFYPNDIGANCFVFVKDGSYGTIDSEGKVITEPKLDAIDYQFLSADKALNERRFVGGYVGTNIEKFYAIDAYGELKETEVYGFGIESFADLYWYNGMPLLNDSWEGVIPYTAETMLSYACVRGLLDNYVYFVKPAVKAVKELNSYKLVQDENGNTVFTKTYKTDKYALFDVKSGKLLTEFIFDDVYSDVEVDGVIAVKRNGKWGYADSKGNMLTALIYDAPDTIDEYDYDKNDGSFRIRERLYLPSNGYIVTYTINGGYGLISADGETVVENKYEFVSQVNEYGEFWICDGGVWSLAKIKYKII